jgi:threonine-phosphate decarboxylase
LEQYNFWADKAHGGRIFEAARILGRSWNSIIDFSANINPLGQPAGLKTALSKSFDESLHYPEPGAENLVEALGRFTGLPERHILPGAGSTPHIRLIPHLLKPKRPVILGPAFAEYQASLEAYGLRPRNFVAKASDGFLVTSRLLDKMESYGPDLIFLANPANPSGRLVAMNFLDRLNQYSQKNGAYLVVDEAFLGFTGQATLESWVPFYPRLLVLRSLTKIFAIPGLRLAYMAASPELVEKFKTKIGPWPISSVAAAAGLFCLTKSAYLEKSRQTVKLLRTSLSQALAPYGQVFPSEANYLLFKTEAEGFSQFLLEKGILIRDASNFAGLNKGYYRLAARPLPEISALARALEAFYA